MPAGQEISFVDLDAELQRLHMFATKLLEKVEHAEITPSVEACGTLFRVAELLMAAGKGLAARAANTTT
jgi:hypothetical protein